MATVAEAQVTGTGLWSRLTVIMKQFGTLIKVGLLVACVVALAYALPQKPWPMLLGQLDLMWHNWPTTLLVILLCPLNWALEAIKWQVLSRSYRPVSFWTSYKGILTGLGIGALMPQGLGDFLGRTWHHKHDNDRQQLHAIPALWLGNFASFQVTHFFGLAGLSYLFWSGQLMSQLGQMRWSWGYGVLTIALLALTLSVYYRVAWYAQPVLRLKWLSRWRPQLERSLQFGDKVRTQALVLATLRYLTFIGQWWLLLRLTGPPTTTDLGLIAAICLIFSLKSSIPRLSLLGDLGVREYTAVIVLQWMGWQAAQVIPLTLFIWVVNLLVPTLIGFVLMLPFFRPQPSKSANQT